MHRSPQGRFASAGVKERPPPLCEDQSRVATDLSGARPTQRHKLHAHVAGDIGARPARPATMRSL